MSEETKKPAEVTPKAKEEGEVETTEESAETTAPSNEGIDYEKELEEEKKRNAPDPLKAQEAFKKRQEKREEDEEPEDDEDKPLTKKELLQLLAKQGDEIKKSASLGMVQNIAKGIASSEAEAKLIVEIHKNRIWPENLSLQDQVEEAQAIANRKRNAAVNSELKRALNSKNGVYNDNAGTHRDPLAGTAPKQSAQDKAAYERAGFKHNDNSRLWEKKLPNGKTLVKDPKTKQTWVK